VNRKSRFVKQSVSIRFQTHSFNLRAFVVFVSVSRTGKLKAFDGEFKNSLKM